MSAGRYLLVRFTDREKLIPAIETIGDSEQISKWNAVDGHFSLVLKLKNNDQAFVETVSNLDGFAEASTCEIVDDKEQDAKPGDELNNSYLFIETAPDKQKAVLEILEKIDAVSFCSPCTGDYDLVAVIQGETFADIDRLVNEQFRMLDGVLRLKQDRIIYLDKI